MSEPSDVVQQPFYTEDTPVMSKEVEVATVTDKPINTTGNKFTRNHSPRSEEDDSNPELNLDSQDTQVSSTMD